MTDNPQWPDLPYAAWSETCETLQLWTQIAGKVVMALTPLINHWWNVTFHVTARGIIKRAIPYRSGVFDIVFDFIDHRVEIAASDGRRESLELEPMTVADFYAAFMERVRRLGIDVDIASMPCEIENCVAFDRDRRHAQYDPARVSKFHQALIAVRPRDEPVSRPLPRQGEPGALLLGQLRSGRDAFFRAHRAAAEGSYAARRRLGDGGSLFARMLQLRLLARQRRPWSRIVLRLRLSGAARTMVTRA